MKTAAGLAMAGGLLIILAAGRGLPGPDPGSADVLDAVHQADRAGRVRILRELANKEFGSDQQKADWHNEQMDELRESREVPYIDELAARIMAGTVSEFADELERGL
jgi:hypothetical protein